MAYDTVVDKTKLEAAITATADAIRAKTGGTGLITWDTSKGFADAVDGLTAGGGGGGSGGDVETCTVVLTSQHGYIEAYCATILEDGEVSATSMLQTEALSVTLENVLCNSAVYLRIGAPILFGSSLTNAELLFQSTGDCAFKVTAKAGETASITVRDDD